MIIQTGKDQAIEITSSPAEMAQKIYEQTIKIEELRKQNKEWKQDAERLFGWVGWQFGDLSETQANKFIQVLSQHTNLTEKYK